MKRTLGIVTLSAALALCAFSSAAAAPGTDGAFNFRMGGFFPSGDSEFCEVNEDAFTLDHSDFNGFSFGAGYANALNNYLEFGLGIDFYYSSVRAADRNFEQRSAGSCIFCARERAPNGTSLNCMESL